MEESQEPFVFLEHTADAKFQAFGKTLEQAFGNAALAMFTEIVDIKKVKPAKEKKIEVQAGKNTTLLYDFLEELIYLLDTEGFLLSGIKDLKIEYNKDVFTLSAVALGDNSKNYEVISAIKSVTYSDMLIDEHHERGVMVQVVVDI